MRGLARTIGLLLIAFGLAAVGPARAGDPASLQRARKLAAQGQVEYALGHHDQALRKFEEAFRNEPVPSLLFNIAQCYRLLGNLKQAATTYRSFLRSDPDNPNVARAQSLLGEVERALSQQASAQTTPPLGLATAGQTGLGPPEVQATAAPELAPSAPAAAATAPAAAVASPEIPAAPKRRRLTWVAAGGAAVAFAGGAVLGSQAASTANSLRTTPHASAELEDLRTSGIHQRQHANLLFAVGGALAVTAGAFWVLRF
jgi:tetratricopeptide (TPR) repeat protein